MSMRSLFQRFRKSPSISEIAVPAIFDAIWYLRVNHDVSEAGVDPGRHFSRHGAREGRIPSPLFDPVFYAEKGTEALTGTLSAVEHYLTLGVSERRAPNAYFDPIFYCAAHEDDVAAEEDPLAHYIAHAREPGHDPHPLFDNDWYAKRYLADQIDVVPLIHFITIGEAEGLSPHPLFDSEYYCRKYPEAVASGMRPLAHYLKSGILEGRQPHRYFDPRFYLSSRDYDTQAVVNPLAHYIAHARIPGHHPNPFFDNDWYIEQHLSEDEHIPPLVHFVQSGEPRWLNPHPLFDHASYLRINPALTRVVADGTFSSPYAHFVEWGSNEIESGRHRQFGFSWGRHWLDFDRASYVQDNPDVEQRIREGRCRTGIEHLFAIGWREARDGMRSIYSDRHAVRIRRVLAKDIDFRHGRHLCLFAHYDRDDVVDPYVIIYLQSLRRLDVDIVFITATNTDTEIDKITPYVTKIIIKNDAGRDFGSWSLALTVLGHDCGNGYERVIFANDSIYFPVRPADPVFHDMSSKQFNLYGLSDSLELGQYHLQSFFLAFDRKAQSIIFPEFSSRFERNYLLTKWGQIREYELGLTQIAQEAGLSVGAFFSGADAREDVIKDPRLSRWSRMRAGIDHLNPTHDLWDLIIGEYGWPGLKLELLRDNPKEVTGFDGLPRLISDGDVPFDVIEHHVRRSKQPALVIRSVEDSTVTNAQVKLIERLDGGAQRPARRLILFAHYDPQAVIDPHVIYQVRSLMEAGCAVSFITAVRDPGQIATVRPFVRDVFVKSESGRDFGSWDLALRALGKEVGEFDYVIWMNDSTYFPLFDPAPMFDEMERRGADFWGIVDSHNIDWHVMSWFWAFGRNAISKWFEWYKVEFDVGYRKWDQIRNYEIRLPRLIRDSGLKVDVYISASDVGQTIIEQHPTHPGIQSALRGDFTMTHTFWREIITEFRCPALKVELVRDNPLLLDLSELLDVIGEHTDYDPELIRAHMSRLKTAHLPSPTMSDFAPQSAKGLS